ncbi:MAG: Fic family protein [Elusimicrobia bacterium]|jgi:Fic family protein|nr:Fic family protein [Elusimicrobiota bacterium]
MTNLTKSPGRWIHRPEGYRAFLPNPLPPGLSFSPRVSRALSDADLLLGRLAGEGKQLPNPHLLIRPFIRREAVLSSRIEGTQATLGELLAVEAGAAVERSPLDLREVGNYVVALEHGRARLKKIPLSLRLIRELHAKLMKGMAPPHWTPGEFRRSQNWIGPSGCTLMNASYVPPPPEELMNCLGSWEKFLHDQTFPPLIQIALAHYQFEAIHPFLDGNGRVGRLLISLFLTERGILPTPLLYLSAFFEATRPEYYERLSGVSARGEWDLWLLYFLSGVARQSEDALSRAERINRILADWRILTAKSPSKLPPQIIDSLAANPFLTTKSAMQTYGVAFSTIQRAIEFLVRRSVLKEVSGGKRDRVYCAQKILRILEEPAQLLPSPRSKRI